MAAPDHGPVACAVRRVVGRNLAAEGGPQWDRQSAGVQCRARRAEAPASQRFARHAAAQVACQRPITWVCRNNVRLQMVGSTCQPGPAGPSSRRRQFGGQVYVLAGAPANRTPDPQPRREPVSFSGACSPHCRSCSTPGRGRGRLRCHSGINSATLGLATQAAYGAASTIARRNSRAGRPQMWSRVAHKGATSKLSTRKNQCQFQRSRLEPSARTRHPETHDHLAADGEADSPSDATTR